MRSLCLALALLVSPPLAAQGVEDKKAAAKKSAPKKKSSAAGAQGAHKKPTPDQIRKFNELQKKQQSTKS